MRLRVGSDLRRALAATVVVGALAAAAPATAGAAGTTLYVSPTGSDAVSCSANAVSAPFATIQHAASCAHDGDAISLAASGKSYPGIGAVDANVTIEAAAGANARKVTVDAGKGPLTVNPGADVAVSGVTLSCITSCGGAPTVTNEGGLRLTDDSVTNNTGIPNAAILSTTPDNSTSSSALTVENSTISGNDSKLGGAIESTSGAGASGASTLSVDQSTVADNVALNGSGGIVALASTPGSTATITAATITGNLGTSGGGLYASSPVALSNTIIAGNKVHSAAAADCEASSGNSIIADGSGGHNLIGNATGCGAIVPGVDSDQTGVARPGLLPLANHGGATNTVALQSGSPAIASGDPATCTSGPTPDLDQRGMTRATAKRGCDIGAFDTAGRPAIHAKWFVAPSGSDTGACSANTATTPFVTIQRALGCAGDGDVISLAASGGAPYPGIGTVAVNVTIEALPGASARTVAVDSSQGPLTVSPGANAILSGVTLNCASDCGGSPTVTNQGALQLSADTITGNDGLPQSAILNATPDGAATSAMLTVENSTISGNDSKLGGAIQSASGSGATGASTLNVVNSTIADNVALTSGGGIAALGSTQGSDTSITNTTITGNLGSSGGGLFASSPVALSNTIIAGNEVHAGGATDCQSGSGNAFIGDGVGGHNLIGNATGCGAISDGTNGDRAGTQATPLDPRLGPLAYNGGTTETEPALAGSPAIGAGSAASCVQQPVFNVDERKHVRNAAARDVCDAGADDTGGAKPAAAAPKITAPMSVGASTSTPLSVTLKASGAPVPALTESGPLPLGVTFTDMGIGTAVLSGTPAAGSEGSYPITITAANGNGSSSRSLVLTVTTGASGS